VGFITRVHNLVFSKERDLANRLYTILGYAPDRLHIYKTAFFHKSLLNENADLTDSNERLEYLGDAVLNAIVAEYLFKKYPNKKEGFLTKMRSKIVKRHTLNAVAEQMEIDVLLREYNNTPPSNSMMGNALEALIGALYLDKGYRKTKVFVIRKILRSYLNLSRLEKTNDNYKSHLLEWCQKNDNNIEFKVVKQFKQYNRDRFTIDLHINGEKVATGEDYNKKGAEQKASRHAIEKLHI
jgi:ribonuclease-3